MKIWDVAIWVIHDKKNPLWEHVCDKTVNADTLEEAVKKGVDDEKKSYPYFSIEARKAELVREVDVE